MSNKAKRTIILEKKPEPELAAPKDASTPMVIPELTGLLHDSLRIIAKELDRYRTITENEKPLAAPEARVVQGYMDTLIKLSKEARERARDQDLSELTDEEVLKLASKYIKNQTE